MMCTLKVMFILFFLGLCSSFPFNPFRGITSCSESCCSINNNQSTTDACFVHLLGNSFKTTDAAFAEGFCGINDNPETLDISLESIFEQIDEQIADLEERQDITFCESCKEALYHVFCSAFVPDCGMIECAADEIEDFSDCASECTSVCTTCDADSIIDDITDGLVRGNSIPSLDTSVCNRKCDLCVVTCIAKTIYESQCREFTINRDMCKELISICACVDLNDITDEVLDKICAYFPEDEGYYVEFPDGLSCEDTEDWCPEDQAEIDTDEHSIRINDRVSITLPFSAPSVQDELLQTLEDVTWIAESDPASTLSSFLLPFFSFFKN